VYVCVRVLVRVHACVFFFLCVCGFKLGERISQRISQRIYAYAQELT
jgi:hypothetical protein